MAATDDVACLPPPRARVHRLVLAVLAGGLTACSDSPSILDSTSADGQRIERLWWLMLAIAGVVFAVILWMIFGSVLRARREETGSAEANEQTGRRIVLWLGLIGTSIVLVVVMVISTFDLRALSLAGPSELRVRVVGQQYWWRVEYPDHGVVTANEIHVPAGEDIAFLLETDDVIHSFWVPEAGPKRDMIPGRATELTLSFAEERVYRGFCTEFCGLQHARMQLSVHSQSPGDFETWIEQQQDPAASPQTELTRRGREVFLNSQCVGCHTIRGVASAGEVGPDLTHLASRSTIGAGVFELTHDNLTRFVANPDSMKPGVIMPPAGLDAPQLDALVAYLESLE